MAYEIGFVDNTGSEGVAHCQMLLKIKALAEANGWTTLRYLNPAPVNGAGGIRELIMKGVGLSGTDEIFVGFRSYQNTLTDVYNLSVAGFTGYVPGNTFTTQPSYFESGIPAHNNRIDYWMIANAQRIAFCMKVGTPVYEHGFVQKFVPYATPSQYPYPLAVGGMLTGIPETRFSDTVHAMPYRGSRANLQVRFVDGVWYQPSCWPWLWSTAVRDTGGSYKLEPPVMCIVPGIAGELDGVFHISGFNNAVENTLVIGGVTYVVLQDVARTGFGDYIAMRMS